MKAIGVGVTVPLRDVPTEPDGWTVDRLRVSARHRRARRGRGLRRACARRCGRRPRSPTARSTRRDRSTSSATPRSAPCSRPACSACATRSEPPKKEEVAIVQDYSGDPPFTDPFVLRLDPDHPEDSIVMVRPWLRDQPDEPAAATRTRRVHRSRVTLAELDPRGVRAPGSTGSGAPESVSRRGPARSGRRSRPSASTNGSVTSCCEVAVGRRQVAGHGETRAATPGRRARRARRRSRASRPHARDAGRRRTRRATRRAASIPPTQRVLDADDAARTAARSRHAHDTLARDALVEPDRCLQPLAEARRGRAARPVRAVARGTRVRTGRARRR